MGAIRVMCSHNNLGHTLTFYEDDVLLGSMGLASSYNVVPAELSLDETRRKLPPKEQLWWDKIGEEIRGGGVRMFFRQHDQKPPCPEPDVLRIVNLIWGSPLLVEEDHRPTEDERRRRTEDIEAWVDKFYRARSARR